MTRLRLELRRSRRALLILGAIAVLSVLTGASIVSRLDLRLPGRAEIGFRVEVASAFGVDPGRTRVTVAGVPAGTITGVDLERGRAVLTVKVDRKYGPIRRDALLSLRPRSQLQDMALDITDRGRGPDVRAGDVLPAAQTHTTTPVSQVLDVFDTATRQRLMVLLDQLGSGLDDRGAALREAFAQLVPFLSDARRLARVTARREALTRRLVRNARLMFDELAAREDTLAQLTADAGSTLRATASERAALDAALAQLPRTLTAMRGTFAVLRGTLDDVDPALRRLRAPVAALPAALRSVRSLATQASPAITALQPTVQPLTSAVNALGPVARSADALLGALKPQVPRLEQPIKDVVACRYPINKFFQHTVSFYKFTSAPGPVGRSELITGSGSGMGSMSPTAFVAGNCWETK